MSDEANKIGPNGGILWKFTARIGLSLAINGEKIRA
jgi:hypothetical protein